MTRVTFLLAVHNGMPYVSEAVESLKHQSVPCRMVIVNDASTDKTAEYLKSLDDPTIQIITNDTNLGLAASLNRGLGYIDTEFVARLDSDDLAMPHRLEEQLAFMDQNPSVGISGGWARIFGNPTSTGVEYFPVGADMVKAYMLFGNPICHPTVLMRRSILQENNLRYDPTYGRSEDLDLWMRASQYTELDNVPTVLTRKRDHPNTVTSVYSETMASQACELHARLLQKIGLHLNSEQELLHWRIGMGLRVRSREEMQKCQDWIQTVCDAAIASDAYDEYGVRKAAGSIWWRLCANSTPLGVSVWSMFFCSGLRGGFSPSYSARLRFLASILWHLARSSVATREEEEQV